jgi:hypothetical protein
MKKKRWLKSCEMVIGVSTTSSWLGSDEAESGELTELEEVNLETIGREGWCVGSAYANGWPVIGLFSCCRNSNS